LEVRPGHRDGRRHGHGQAQGDRDAGHGRRRGHPDPRRHGPDGGTPLRAHLARRPGGTDLGRYERDPAPHHQPRPPAPARGL
ncbi:MAG: Acyl-CoA dehydrogenase PA4979, partial [uncultured Rubellimicrobium sp.]